jgi:predicted nucleotidyltransferase component of viral defense system
MNDALEFMLGRYACQTQRDYENALKEIIQEIALLGLWRAKFFEKAAFYGGTALRILYGLDRFSEDLDFSLLSPESNFQLAEYLYAVHIELESFGFEVFVGEKVKTATTAIQSAFIKAGTKEHLLKIKAPISIHQKINHAEMLKVKVKIEIDINPPGEFDTEAKILLLPIPFTINTYQQPDLFAGKIHALICRPWKIRVKGRDWYDFVWYISRNIPMRLRHLQARLQQTEHWPANTTLTRNDIVQLLKNKIQQIDFEQAKKDVLPFLKNHDSTALWSAAFFNSITEKIQTI